MGALALAEHLEATGTKLVTTRAVLLEIGNALSRQRYRRAAVQLTTDEHFQQAGFRVLLREEFQG